MNKPFIFFSLFLLLFCANSFATIDSEDCGTSTCSFDFTKLNSNEKIDMINTLNSESLCIIYFYSDTCGHCKNVKPFLEEMEEKYGSFIKIHKYEVSDPKNIALYNSFCSISGYEGKGIPLLGVNDIYLAGESQIFDKLESEIERGLSMEEHICPIEGQMVCGHSAQNQTSENSDTLIPNLNNLEWSSIIPIIVIAGLGDGINPCAFVILIFVMVFLQSISGSRKRILKITVTYIFALFITNTLLGVLYFFVTLKIGFPNFIKYAVIIVSVVAGIINIKDFFWYGKGISLGVPKKTKKYLQQLISMASVPASLILGVSVAILEAPCSVPIYLAVIEVLKGEGARLLSVIPYILLYNLMFIVPLVVLSTLVSFGYRAHILEKKSLEAKRYMKLGIGIILLVLAALLYYGVL
jgi:cytochrome c biogenesis protein CcdA/thiol-disulfide isomerase/thioredoxin